MVFSAVHACVIRIQGVELLAPISHEAQLLTASSQARASLVGERFNASVEYCILINSSAKHPLTVR